MKNLNLWPAAVMRQPTTKWGQATNTDGQTTGSTTLVDVPSSVVTLTLTRPALVVAMATMSVYHDTAGQYVLLALSTSGGSPLGVYPLHVFHAAAQLTVLHLSGAAFLPAGDQTIKLRWLVSGGNATVSYRNLLAFVSGEW